MCGIVGILDLGYGRRPAPDLLRRMLGAIRHRGPDAFGVYVDDQVGLGNARLSIVDLAGGNQPIHNEDQTVWIVYNGEVFNYVELRARLERRGHRFATSTDTEAIVHLYEDLGSECVRELNGQFAFAIWNSRTSELLLGRDRLGVRPLYYTVADGSLVFGSEIKAIFADDRVPRELDPVSLDQVFTGWTPLPGRSAFRQIKEILPGHTLRAGSGEWREHQYWKLAFPEADVLEVDGRRSPDAAAERQYVEEFRELLTDAVRLRLRADVPVGAYLSGGLDSSTIAAAIRQVDSSPLSTFSVTFDDPAFDESSYQQFMARQLGVEHHSVRCHDADIARVFPDVVWHTETPVLRTAPAPLYVLSKLVNESRFKVVLTGEGADEFLGGYDIFKEDRIRRFWARSPKSEWRAALFRRIYPFLPSLQRGGQAYVRAFFGYGLTETDRRAYSHSLRWSTTSRLKRLYSRSLRDSLANYDARLDLENLAGDEAMLWHPLSRAQFYEVVTFLSPYLLSSQGDRMAMAHSVEGRFPFLDHRVVEFCNRLPPALKLRGLNEKYLLKKAFAHLVPSEIRTRPKQPYRAPAQRAFFGPNPPEYVGDLMSDAAITEAGLFDASAVRLLAAKATHRALLSETDSMSLVGVLSTQLVHHQFTTPVGQDRAPLPVNLDCLVDRRTSAAAEGSASSAQ